MQHESFKLFQLYLQHWTHMVDVVLIQKLSEVDLSLTWKYRQLTVLTLPVDVRNVSCQRKISKSDLWNLINIKFSRWQLQTFSSIDCQGFKFSQMQVLILLILPSSFYFHKFRIINCSIQNESLKAKVPFCWMEQSFSTIVSINFKCSMHPCTNCFD